MLCLKKNDCLSSVLIITGLSANAFAKKLITHLNSINFLYDEEEEAGLTILELCEMYEVSTVDEIVKYLFPENQQNEEFIELFGGIQFWGDGIFEPCDSCGFEMDLEIDGYGKHHWTNKICTNSKCGVGYCK